MTADRDAPRHGARFELTRQEGQEGAGGPICYTVRVHLSEAFHDYELGIATQTGACDLRGPVSQPEDAPPPPPWVPAHVLALGRQLWRGREAGWPRRLMRWRNK